MIVWDSEKLIGVVMFLTFVIYVDELLILTSVHCWTLCVNDGFDCTGSWKLLLS
jgi:hypothetical protein